MKLRFLAVTAAGALLVAAPYPSFAQGMFKQGSNPQPAARPAPPPPALPGASSDNRAVAPPSRIPMDMEPNEALFDAINRGDIATARDAINRGADLRGRNVLGMTPLELAIDLGRNDISFMLLSMRAAEEGPARPPPRATTASKQAQRAPRAAPEAPAPPVARASVQPPATPARTARLFSGDGGAPNPDAGFLGFDPGRR